MSSLQTPSIKLWPLLEYPDEGKINSVHNIPIYLAWVHFRDLRKTKSDENLKIPDEQNLFLLPLQKDNTKLKFLTVR